MVLRGNRDASLELGQIFGVRLQQFVEYSSGGLQVGHPAPLCARSPEGPRAGVNVTNILAELRLFAADGALFH